MVYGSVQPQAHVAGTKNTLWVTQGFKEKYDLVSSYLFKSLPVLHITTVMTEDDWDTQEVDSCCIYPNMWELVKIFEELDHIITKLMLNLLKNCSKARKTLEVQKCGNMQKPLKIDDF